MKLQRIIISCLVLVTGLTTHGQDNFKNRVNLSSGVGHLARQDLVFSPFVHTTVSPINLTIGYIRSADIYQSVHLRYASYTPMLTETYNFMENGVIKTAGPHYLTFLAIDYTAGKAVLQSDRSRLVAGGSFQSKFQLLNYVYGRIGNFGYFASMGSGPWGLFEITTGQQSTISFSEKLKTRISHISSSTMWEKTFSISTISLKNIQMLMATLSIFVITKGVTSPTVFRKWES